jgi:TetR/AcrR family transcriptional regulator of autoinduction and epiphytic fitness
MDGRVRRGETNRQAIVDAALALVAEEGAFPTAQSIAGRAGVAKRSLFHHFPDMDSLLAFAAEAQAARHWHLLRPPAPGLNLEERIHEAVAQRAGLFEAIGDVRRVAARNETGSPVLAERLKQSRSALRRHVRRMLNPEYSALDRSRQEGVQAMASWETWEVLRRHQGLSAEAAEASVKAMIESALERVSAKEI